MKNTHTYVNITPIPLWDLLLEHPAEQTQMEVSLEESLCDTVWGEPPEWVKGREEKSTDGSSGVPRK